MVGRRSGRTTGAGRHVPAQSSLILRHHTSSSNRRRFLGVWATGLAIGRARSVKDDLAADVKKLCRDYIAGFGSAATQLCYHHRLDGPGGLGVLEKPEQIAKANTRSTQGVRDTRGQS